MPGPFVPAFVPAVLADRGVDEFQVAQILTKLSETDADTLRHVLQVTREIAEDEASVTRHAELEQESHERLSLQNRVWSAEEQLQRTSTQSTKQRTAAEAICEGYDACISGFLSCLVGWCMCFTELAACCRQDQGKLGHRKVNN